MSLLIKALDKAQDKAQKKSQEKSQDTKVKQGQAAKAKQEPAQKLQESRPKSFKSTSVEADSGLSLSPPAVSLLEEAGFEPDLIPVASPENAVKTQAAPAQKEASKPVEQYSVKPVTQTTNQAKYQPASKAASQSSGATPAQAANVFSAKRVEATNQNAKLALIVGAGLIALLAMGVYYYQFVDSAPDIAVAPRPIAAQPMPALLPQVSPPQEVAQAAPIEPPTAELEAPAPDTTEAFEPSEAEPPAQKQKIKANAQPQNTDAEMADVENTLAPNEAVASASKKSKKSNVVKMDKVIASESASIQVSQTKPSDSINPTLMRAYEAYNAGNDSEAQKLYKQVLQRESLNTDAMLGLGAIATRQGRVADANGWYRKVLGLDPRNSTAQAALLDTQQQDDPQVGESRIKSMLAKSPNDANLHAALGNLYAEQNQWFPAQQAYFDAYRLNASADNAFNLAVSLDQMNKPKLALTYYRQALQLAEQSGASSIDKAALDARIAAIQ